MTRQLPRAQSRHLRKVPPPILFWRDAVGFSQIHLRQLLQPCGFYLEGARITHAAELPTRTNRPESAIRFLRSERPLDWPLDSIDAESEETKLVLQTAADHYLRYLAKKGPVVEAPLRAEWYFGALAYGRGACAFELAEIMSRFEQRIRSHYVVLANTLAEGADYDVPAVQFGKDTEWMCGPDRADGTPVSKLRREETEQALRWLRRQGARGDLRRAGLLGAHDATCRAIGQGGGDSGGAAPERGPDLTSRQVERNWETIQKSAAQIAEDGALLPTALVHPGARAFRERKELEARLFELGGDPGKSAWPNIR